MNKRRLIAILIAFVLTVAATAMWSAATLEREGDPDANVLEDSGSETGVVNQQKKDGNKVVRVLAAPFKAFGRLFRHMDRIERMNETDGEKFVSVGVSRTEDGRYPEADKVMRGGMLMACHHGLNDAQISHVMESVSEFMKAL